MCIGMIGSIIQNALDNRRSSWHYLWLILDTEWSAIGLSFCWWISQVSSIGTIFCSGMIHDSIPPSLSLSLSHAHIMIGYGHWQAPLHLSLWLSYLTLAMYTPSASPVLILVQTHLCSLELMTALFVCGALPVTHTRYCSTLLLSYYYWY